MATDPLWYQDAVFYEVYVRAFADSNGDGHGDLRGLTGKLDYLKDLGVTCLWLLPIYPSPLKDDGYDIADYYGVHATYGGLDDFRTLLTEAHARGLKVIADLVLNHTSDQHPWFQAARADRNSPYRDYYVWSDTDQPYRDARIIFLDTEPSNWTWDEQAGQYFWHRFYASQPDLNYDNPAVRAAMLEVAKFWLDLGVDGFRADAVPYLIEREGTNCENLPETHAYLKDLRRYLDEHYPGRILLCEANQWPEDVRPYFGAGDEFHMGFHFPVMPRIYMALKRGDAAPLDWILGRTPALPENCQWCTFLRNHDELTLEMVTPEERDWMWAEYAPEPRMRLNLGIRRRLAPLLDNDRRKLELANALLFALPGSPVLYYGDEIGMGDNIDLFDRNGVRTPMQWEAAPAAGFSSADPARFYAPVISSAAYGPARVNVAAQQADPGSLLNFHRALIRERAAHPALSRGTCAWQVANGGAVFTLTRSLAGATLTAVYNFTAQPQTVPVAAGSARVVFGSRTAGAPALTGAALALPPYGFAWLAASTPH
ncbi:MAG: maltose alpha-D-glucosyltransferase [Anaerolineales bacterium]|nr:maltose alpha-D-glucosyltransferase [Anaerolineales bacterium]